MKSDLFSDLKNKTAVITGGSGVIGSSIIKALLSSGVKVAVITRNKVEARKKLPASLKNHKNVFLTDGDILESGSMILAKKEINNKFGRVDILINCAGGNYPKATTAIEVLDRKTQKSKSFFALDTKDVHNVFVLNFLGTFIPSQVFAEDMAENGKGVILNISSISSLRPLTKVSAYSAAKAAINNFTQWLSVHLAPMNIRVNAVAPGFILAEQNRFLLIDKDSGKLTKRGEKIIAATPMKRFVEPEEIQGAVLFLVSDLSKVVTGILLPVDGGFSAYSGV